MKAHHCSHSLVMSAPSNTGQSTSFVPAPPSALAQSEFSTLLSQVAVLSPAQLQILSASLNSILGITPVLQQSEVATSFKPGKDKFGYKDPKIRPESERQAINWSEKAGKALNAALQQYGVAYRKDGAYKLRDLRVAQAQVIVAAAYGKAVKAARDNHQELPKLEAWRESNWIPVRNAIADDPAESKTDEEVHCPPVEDPSDPGRKKAVKRRLQEAEHLLPERSKRAARPL